MNTKTKKNNKFIIDNRLLSFILHHNGYKYDFLFLIIVYRVIQKIFMNCMQSIGGLLAD